MTFRLLLSLYIMEYQVMACSSSKPCFSLHNNITQLTQSGCLITLLLLPLQIQATFFDVTLEAGLDLTGKKGFGNPSWVDINDDGRLDLAAPHHSQGINFYRNLDNASFLNITDTTGVVSGIAADRHGYAWADYDNDGDIDFFVQHGRFSGSNTSASELWKNEGNEQFTNVTVDSQISLFGRTANWLDYNNDGILDILLQYEAAVTLYRQNKDHTFTDVTNEAGLSFDQVTGNFKTAGSVADFDKDGDMDIFIGGGQKDQLFLNNGAGFFTKIFLSNKTHSKGMAWGDYDNDGDLDLYVARGTSDYYQALVWDPSSITFARAIFRQDSPQEIAFNTTGQNVTFKLIINQNASPSGIKIGAEQISPISNPFTLQSASGKPVFTPGAERSFYVWQDETSTWHVQWSNNGGRRNFYGVITSDGLISDLTASYTPFDANKENHLYRNDGNGIFVDVTSQAGINIVANNYGAIWGDYDNDEDLDLYVTDVGDITGNKANHLFTNNGDGTFTDFALEQNVDALDVVGRHYGAAWGDYNNDGALDLFLSQGFGWGYPGSKGQERLYKNAGNSNHWLKINPVGVLSNSTGLGVHVKVQTATSSQWRHLNGGGGGQLYSQGSGPLHFGLGNNTNAATILVKWPSGIVQQMWQIPGDQSIDIFEQVKPAPHEKPVYQGGIDEGVFVWKDSFDGAYHIRSNGSGTKTTFDIKLVSSEPVTSSPFHLESNDIWSQSTFGFSLTSIVSTWHDGVDFKLPPGAKALLSVEQDGVPNPRQLHVGSNNSPMTPAGWILQSASLPLRPDFSVTNKPGLFVGYNPSGSLLEARFISDGTGHRNNLSLISSKALISAVPKDLEGDDQFTQTSSSVSLGGYVSSTWDGVDVTFDTTSDLGISYLKDDIFQPRMVNPDSTYPGKPNAYHLPRATPYGKPEYDSATESGLFVWKDKRTGIWHVQGTAGNGFTRYRGVITSDLPFTNLSTTSFEAGDTIDTTDPKVIVFEMQMSSPFQDGFEFKVPTNAKVQLNLQPYESTNPAESIRMGTLRWSVEQLPVDISGW